MVTDRGGFVTTDEDIGFGGLIVGVVEHFDLALPLVGGAADGSPLTGRVTYVAADSPVINRTGVLRIQGDTDCRRTGDGQPAARLAIDNHVLDWRATTLSKIGWVTSPTSSRLTAFSLDRADKVVALIRGERS